MPNSFAYLMLLAWPAIAVALYRLLPFERALIWSILGAYLILPQSTAFDLPVIPALDKNSIPNLVAVACCALVCRRRLQFRPASAVATLLLLVYAVTPLATVLTNTEPLFYGSLVLPGLPLYDAGSMIAFQIIFILPFFLARQFLATAAAQRELLVALTIGALAYSIPILGEIRLSPQFHYWFYGFAQHDFVQTVRQGGYRPMVFLSHGLTVAFFVMSAVIAAFALWRATEHGKRTPIFVVAVYLAIILVLCKSFGSLLYLIFLVPLVVLGGRKLQIRIAAMLAILTVAYPILRGEDQVPTEWMVETARQVEVERGNSLEFRFMNEALLLEHAQEKPLFGWGGWNRNRVFDETGLDISTTDGAWIILLGTFGWSGFIAQFGLLALPLVLLWWRIGRFPDGEASPYLGALSLLLAANMVELIPNSTLVPLTWLITGALLGHAENLAARRSTQRVRIRSILGDAGARETGPESRTII